MLRAQLGEHPAVELDVERALLDERDDLPRSDHAVRGVRPPRERLGTDELAGGYVHLWLELERQRATGDGTLQILRAQANDRHDDSLRGARKERVDKRARVHGHEIVRFLPDAQELHR